MKFFFRFKALIFLSFCLGCLNQNVTTVATCPASGEAAPFPTPDATFRIDLSQPGLAIPTSFLGFSYETSDITKFTGTFSEALNAVNPLLVQLLVNLELCNNGAPMTRAGGASTDQSWFNLDPNAPLPPGITYTITPDWIGGIAAVATVIQGQAIVGFNMVQVEGGDPVIPITMVGAFNEFPAGILHSVEGGNEPDLYAQQSLRFPGYSLVSPPAPPFSYLVDFVGITDAMKMNLPTVPPFAAPVLSDATWLPEPGGLGSFLTALTGAGAELALVTQHDYPLDICNSKPSTDPTYPTIPLLLDNQSSQGQADLYAPFVQVANTFGLPFRMTEMNSVDCGGLAGVSDTFASALWAIDIMFEMARVGVAGVNFHNKTGAPYNAFDFTQSGTQFSGTVNPLYYAAFLFSQSTCNQAQLLPVEVLTPPQANLKVWATFEAPNFVHVVVLNKDTQLDSNVALQLSSNSVFANVIQLTAPSLAAKNGITLAGQTFDGTVDGGPQGTYAATQLCPINSAYGLTVPAGSAAKLTVQLQ